MSFKEDIKLVAIYSGIILSLLSFPRGCNMVLNNRSIEHPGYQYVSRVGPFSHVQFTRFADDSHEVKKYPVLGRTYFGSDVYQDLDGDGLVDRIRKNGPEWKMNRLSELLIREHDYVSNQKRFENADQDLQKLIQKYPARK